MRTETPINGPESVVGIVHGAGYVGRELIELVLGHPDMNLHVVTSGSAAGSPIWSIHKGLRGKTKLSFSEENLEELLHLDALFLAGAHGTSYDTVAQLLAGGFKGCIVDLTQDFRYDDLASHEHWTGKPHPYPELLDTFVYGLPELRGPYPADTRLVANPGCFATAIGLALAPIAKAYGGLTANVTALTGASGAGFRPSPTTHFPNRDGNVRAYNPMVHRHTGEILASVEHKMDVAFVPVSGPWIRGIWGTAQITLSESVAPGTISTLFEDQFRGQPFIRLWNDELPELRFTVASPFCDLGWKIDGRNLLVVFAIDNLLKGAATQAVQNMNIMLGLPETTGLLPGSEPITT